MSMTDTETRVLYNADCPVCSFEINHYAAYAQNRALPLRFEDLNTAELADWGLTRDAAARRLYVLKEGRMLSGIPAFLALWSDMPRYRWLARLVGLPGIRHLAVLAYDYVLAPLIYRWHLRRQARRQSARS
jgi:predicted DCC family thiol-disulfide oxidoreductase YuxK